MTMISTPEGIAFFRLATLKAGLSLELKGLKRRGRSCYSILKSEGFKGSRETVYKAVCEEVEKRLREREEATRLTR